MANTEIRLIIFFAAKDKEALYSQEKQDREPTVAQIHELLIAKFRLKFKKVGESTRPFRSDQISRSVVSNSLRPFRYDLMTYNQIPYDYTAEVRNRFKGLDLIECLMNYRQRFVTLYMRQ